MSQGQVSYQKNGHAYHKDKLIIYLRSIIHFNKNIEEM